MIHKYMLSIVIYISWKHVQATKNICKDAYSERRTYYLTLWKIDATFAMINEIILMKRTIDIYNKKILINNDDFADDPSFTRKITMATRIVRAWSQWHLKNNWDLRHNIRTIIHVNDTELYMYRLRKTIWMIFEVRCEPWLIIQHE